VKLLVVASLKDVGFVDNLKNGANQRKGGMTLI
jgi:hypothetical protein